MAASTRASSTTVNDANETCLDSLPAEMINAILEDLRPHDLTKLARVSTKYRDIVQYVLWRSIELHRQDAHHECFGLSSQDLVRRAYLDGQLVDPWSYRGINGVDYDFDRCNTKFGTAVRKLYRTAGKSQAWMRLSPFVVHLCLTATHKSPPQIWDMILSLANLTSVEVVGEFAPNSKGPPQPASLREPGARKVRNIRLRGYIPAKFVLQMCKASASSITSLDLGVLEMPKEYIRDAEEMELQDDLGFPLHLAPRGILWFANGPTSPTTMFSSLTHLLLCKRGEFDGPPDMSEEEDFEIRQDEGHELNELKQWASLLRSVRSTLVELVLEQRPVYLSYLLDPGMGMEISPHDPTSFCPILNVFDAAFYKQILKPVFDDGGETWPKLKKLTLRGINMHGFETEANETFQAFADRALPGVVVQEVPGNYMFFNTRNGIVLNQEGGADGLKPHLDPNTDPHRDDELDFLGLFF
ncbi:hypothetical protein CC86DRAFT_372511 [Ophiobolus disseminans]|uniref:F-box domain-containing protein n=1 Tax=Ophiobolus disseminans TaxID=1469910 RepID=A0A6A6ZSI3_9PLEO|nr:hypothetical protein CC86DRAFT_372511 [Ophiobolus disseminans]